MTHDERLLDDALQIEEFERNIARVFESATDAEIEHGLTWYSNARDYCAKLASRFALDTDTVATVVSALSPNNSWESNKLDAELVLSAWYNGIPVHKIRSVQTYPANIRKAYAILNSGNLDLVKAPKTWNFAQCLMGNDGVCIDRHAFCLALGKYSGNELPMSLTAHRYALVSQAYRNVAANVHIKPSQLQAICWVTWHRMIANGETDANQTSFNFGALEVTV